MKLYFHKRSKKNLCNVFLKQDNEGAINRRRDGIRAMIIKKKAALKLGLWYYIVNKNPQLPYLGNRGV